MRNSNCSPMASIHHLSTGYVSHDYHMVFDNLFSTGDDDLVDDIFNQIFDSVCYLYYNEVDFPSDDSLVYHPLSLDEGCLNEPDHHACCIELQEHYHLAEIYEQVKWIEKHLMALLDHF